ncbi:MAG: replicative DNA helicase [Pleurocapsa minor GSE-CHR-MK-17-07R]|nr:replicative DNA helicase [Pleurocapsa minor GSE-CHR-MK 17-07R]
MNNAPTTYMQVNQSPFSQEAEEAVLGAVLINPDAFLALAAFLKPDDFFFVRHQYIWEAFMRISERRDRVDYITVHEELRTLGKLDDVGGAPYLLQLTNSTPTSVHAEIYGRLVERTSLRRKLIKAADDIKALAHEESRPIETVVADAEAKLFAVTESGARRDLKSLKEAVDEYFDQTEYRMLNPDIPRGLPTGFRDIDELLGGLQRSDLLIFAGRPGMGKTSFLLSVALNAARVGGRIAIFTMEMGTEQIVQRLMSMETGINTQNMRGGRLSQSEWSKFVKASTRLSTMNMFIDDTPGVSPLELRTKCRRMMHEHGLDLVIIDYLQLMSVGGYENNRVQEISYISRSLKEMARELDVPVFSAAQLSRAVEQRQDKRPVLSDLRESGSLEQDADIVAFLYRDEVYNQATEFPSMAEIIIQKHRNGPTGTVNLHFEKSLTKFSDARTQSANLRDL